MFAFQNGIPLHVVHKFRPKNLGSIGTNVICHNLCLGVINVQLQNSASNIGIIVINLKAWSSNVVVNVW